MAQVPVGHDEESTAKDGRKHCPMKFGFRENKKQMQISVTIDSYL
jgi:hypothetical protein